MSDALPSLIAANVAFVGVHFALSHPLRAPLVRALGEKAFLGLYSLIVFATLAWIVVAFRAVGPGAPTLWDGTGDVAWVVASVLTLVALALIGAAHKGNPAAIGMSADAVAAARPEGVFAVTRHPMMWGFALWAIAHVLVMPSPRTLATAGGVAVLALVGSHLQDRKKAALLGDTWRQWQARTSFAPRLSRIGAVPLRAWLIALVLWLALTWLHGWLGAVPAGTWRWWP